MNANLLLMISWFFIDALFPSNCETTTTFYYYDVSQINDGELGSKALQGFYIEGGHSKRYEVNSEALCKELISIKDSILKVEPEEIVFDDGFYGYSFIFSSNDTIYADYQLGFWRYKEFTGAFDGSKVKDIIQPYVSNKIFIKTHSASK